MNVDLIVIGNELLNGKIKDENTHFLAKFLHKQGHNLRAVHIIQDEYIDLEMTLNSIKAETDFIITTGGLGPTEDDNTKNFLAQFFRLSQDFNQEALEIVKAQYLEKGKTYSEDDHNYHIIPEGFTVVKNPIGYAPCLYTKINDLQILSAPGVPSEFKGVLQSLANSSFSTGTKKVKHHIFKTYRLPEAKIFKSMEPKLWEKLSQFGEVSSLPHKLGVDIGIKLTAETDQEILEKKEALNTIMQDTTLKDFIWHIGSESLEEVIIEKAKEKGLTIGFSESCTGGLLAHRLTNVSGSSSVFWGSIVSYANEVKMGCLQVEKDTLKNHGAVSEQTAFEMAIGARKNLGVDIAISTTGIAGPLGGSPEKPVGTVGIGSSTKEITESEILHFQGDRDQLKYAFSQAALYKLLDIIIKHPGK